MSNLLRVARAVYCEPWLIEPSMHRVLCQILDAHMAGGELEMAARLRGDALLAAGQPGKDGKAVDAPPYVVQDGIAVVPLHGVIGRRVGTMEKSSGVTDVDAFAAAVRAAGSDPAVRAVMLDVDSPGGTVGGVQDAADAVRQVSGKKHTLAFSGGTMASAAYWIASGAEAIYADQTAVVGSIGVYTYVLDTSRADEQRGIKAQVFASGKYKGAGAAGQPLTDEQREEIQGRVNDLAAVFKGDVRRFNPAISDDAMQGQTFLGERARAAGLINSVSTFARAFNDLRSRI
jgi:signal peptide peptidase SppA